MRKHPIVKHITTLYKSKIKNGRIRTPQEKLFFKLRILFFIFLFLLLLYYLVRLIAV